MRLDPECELCKTFLVRERAAGRVPRLGHLTGLGDSVQIGQGDPESHYGFPATRGSHPCPVCGRRIVSLEDHPRGWTWTTHLELARDPLPAARPSHSLASSPPAWSVVAVTSASRWNIGERHRRTRRVAASGPTALRVAVGKVVVSLDGHGQSAASPLHVGDSLAISGDGRLAAGIDGTLRIVDLATGQMRVEVPRNTARAQLLWSHDGSTLCANGVLLGSDDGEFLGQLPGQVLGLSHDGTLAVVLPRPGGLPVVMDRAGEIVMRLPPAAAAASRCAWSGRTLALVSRGATVLVDLEGRLAAEVVSQVGGLVLALDATSGRFLVGGERGAASCELGRPPRRYSGVEEPFAIGPDGSALVWVGATLERLDLERGTRTGVGDETPVPIRAIVDDPCGEGLFVGQGGTVTLWEASLTARLRHFPHLPGFRMVTTDGALLLAVEEGTVVAVARDGTPRWKTTMAIPQTEDGRSWMLEGLEIVEDDAKVVVVRLTFFALREDDGVVEAVASTCVERLLHRLDGAVIAERAGPLAQKSSTGGAWVVSNRGDVLVDGYKVPMGVGLGQITAARLSKDQRSLHVGTSLGQLMHLSRPSRGVASTVR